MRGDVENLDYFSVYEVQFPMITTVAGDRKVIDCRIPSLPAIIIYYKSDSSEADLVAYQHTLMQDFGWQDMTDTYAHELGNQLQEFFILEHSSVELKVPIQIGAMITSRGYAIKIDPVEIEVELLKSDIDQ